MSERAPHIDIVFDGSPGPEAGRFVEVENAMRQSIRFGEWLHRDDGYWVLRIADRPAARETLAAAMMECGLATGHGDTFEDLLGEMKGGVERISKLVYVPGQWRCAKCDFRLTQSNLYAATGTVGPRDEAGDKCPNCNGPLWRVSAMDDRNEAFRTANEMFDKADKAEKSLRRALELGVICGRMLAEAKCGNEIESLQEGIMTDAGLTKADKIAMNHQVNAIEVTRKEVARIAPKDALHYGSYMLPEAEQAELKALIAACEAKP